MKKLIKYLTLLAGAIIILFIWFLIYFAITEFRPKNIIVLKENEKKEFEEVNCILISGNFNQSAAGFIPKYRESINSANTVFLPKDFLTGWKINYVCVKPFSRNLRKPYDPQEPTNSVIDFYTTSPNIEATKIKLADLRFQYSDHQPILFTFKFIK